MKIKKLKKDNHKIIIGGLIAFCLIAVTVTYLGTRAKYQNTEIIPLVNGVVNYKAYDFKVMAMYQQKEGSNCTEDSCYNTITTMPETGYTINEEKSYCTIDNKTHSSAKLYTNNLGEHVFSRITKSDKCYLWFDKQVGNSINKIVQDSTIKLSINAYAKGSGADLAVLAPGIFTFQYDDPMYGTNAKTTYFRGMVTNNWLKFAGHFWRIIRKNGDGTLRLIYTGTAEGIDASKIPNVGIRDREGSIAMGTGTQIGTYMYVDSSSFASKYPAYVGWTYKTGVTRPTNSNNNGNAAKEDPSNTFSSPNNLYEYRSTAYEQALTWFNANISATDKIKVDEGKFCNDRETPSGTTPSTSSSAASYYYNVNARLNSSTSNPSLACTNAGDVYSTKVGLITADEVILAGGIYGRENNGYYLYTNQPYFTMSPHSWEYKNGNGYNFIYSVFNNGVLEDVNVGSGSLGIRPVINLKADVTISSGSGLYNDPYIVA